MPKVSIEEFREEFKQLFAEGIIRIEGTLVVGIALDGEEVTIGDTANLCGATKYLRTQPREDW